MSEIEEIKDSIKVYNTSIHVAEDSTLLDDDAKMLQVHRNLKVLSALRDNQKLSTSGLQGIKVEEHWAPLQFIIRYFTSEDREKNLQCVSRTLNEAFRLVDAALRRQETLNNKASNVRELIVRKLRNQQVIERLRLSIQAACNGIKTLTETYKHDRWLVAAVEVLLDQTSDKLSEIDRACSLLSLREDI